MGPVALIGAAWGLGARDGGCSGGPLALERAGLAARLSGAGTDCRWRRTFAPRPGDTIPTLCGQLRDEVAACVREYRRWTVIGGDHSCAVGTWSGVATAYTQPFGLIWVDAHLDAHTPETSPSGAVHGMPLAVLLGYGAAPLIGVSPRTPVLRPEHVSLIGARDFEAPEAELLHRIGVRVHFMDEVHARGLTTVFTEAAERLRRRTGAFGVSIDLDAVDPRDAPGVGSPAPGGIAGAELRASLAGLGLQPGFLGLELVELNPARDENDRTVDLACALVQSTLTPAEGGQHATVNRAGAQGRRL